MGPDHQIETKSPGFEEKSENSAYFLRLGYLHQGFSISPLFFFENDHESPPTRYDFAGATDWSSTREERAHHQEYGWGPPPPQYYPRWPQYYAWGPPASYYPVWPQYCRWCGGLI
ncbi:uncharacterized protein LOC135385004 [Ornithodoros turicata]|uniref:uncharacterized protein LOC135385004 n=1 Tax=Ornithodoros turicata TaxID=34597 RepID=UPI00313983A0